MRPAIHQTAIVEPGAFIGEGVMIGPYCYIGANVRIGAGSQLLSHISITGKTTIGDHVQIFPFSSIGAPSQDLKASLADGALEIGSHCLIREHVTINSGVEGGTNIGKRCVFLAAAHVAHDCQLGDDVILSNQVLLGGHVHISNHVTIGGGAAVHQQVRIGSYAFIAGLAGVEGDVIPFSRAAGNRAHLFGLNLIGMQRNGVSQQRIEQLKKIYHKLFDKNDHNVFEERLEKIKELFHDNTDAQLIIEFLMTREKRPLCAPRHQAQSL